MIPLLRNIKNNHLVSLLAVILVFFPLEGIAKAKPIGHVEDVQGTAFVVKNGQTLKASRGTLVYDFSEFITEEGAQVTIVDFEQHTFHLAGSGHLKFLNKMIELKRGYLWIQSQSDVVGYSVQTANSMTSYKKGELIVSFDNSNGRTQTLVISGEAQFSNLLEKNLKVSLKSSQFSFVDKEYESGAPRNPTLVGFRSFKKITSLFHDVSPLQKSQRMMAKKNEGPGKTKVQRLPASTPNKQVTLSEETPVDHSRGKIILLRDSKAARKLPSKFNRKSFIEKKAKSVVSLKPKDYRVYRKKSKVPVRIFGFSKSKKASGFIDERLPATFRPKSSPKGSIELNQEFNKSLNQQYKTQQRHRKEVKSLIKDLKNFDSDYKADY